MTPSAGPGGLWSRWLDDGVEQIRAQDRWRSPVTFDASGIEGRLGSSGRRVVSFAGNDYLGLSTHPDVVAAAHEAVDRWGTGSGSSRLVVGTRPVHIELERALAEWKGTEAALLFSTGYAANLGVLSALGGEGAAVFSDELNHASIVDGCRLSRAPVTVYPHLDVERLEKMMHGVPGRAVVVSETVFSMDGDGVPLDRLIQLCASRQALLVLDDAHGILGPSPGAAAARLGADVELIVVGTLSKALGSLGGFVAASGRWVDWFVNRARPFVYTTAPTPADCAAAGAALQVLRSDRGRDLVARLRGHVDALRPGHDAPILPVVLGSERRALDAASALLEAGLLVPAIRPPTVPPGTSRLRIAVSAAHSDAQVAQLIAALASLGLS